MGSARPTPDSTGGHRHHHAIGRALLAAALAGALGACTHTSPTADHAAAPPASRQHAAPDTICAQFGGAALSSNTALDNGPADARRRAAAQFGTPRLIGQLTGQGADSGWATLVAHQATVSVRTTPIADDPPPAGPNQVAAGVLAHPTATGSGGWQELLPATVVYCTLIPAGPEWKVNAVTFSDDGTAATPMPATP